MPVAPDASRGEPATQTTRLEGSTSVLRTDRITRSSARSGSSAPDSTTSASTPLYSTTEPIVYHSTPMPPDYDFVPKGNMCITRHCRLMAQQAHQTVHAVVDEDEKVHLGIRVPKHISTSVRRAAITSRLDRKLAVEKRDTALAKQFEENILKLFPQTPRQAILPGIISRAMKKGAGRVGRTGTIEIEEKATLAVRAHIRHQLTEYDVLLRKGVQRDQARVITGPQVNLIAKSFQGKVKPRLPLAKKKEKSKGSARAKPRGSQTRYQLRRSGLQVANPATEQGAPRAAPQVGHREPPQLPKEQAVGLREELRGASNPQVEQQRRSQVEVSGGRQGGQQAGEQGGSSSGVRAIAGAAQTAKQAARAQNRR
ncbi:Uu.00g000410.m01.CDS01 [Anthostomella pinea]|uniref:Uu.00g000410.m01.CDS01 n=1 Tax=Anthostomella pinea TaxID=933095 RepID=A0AAI8YIF7_9PEZI|nr:Uu.00g000410.m01.CDS01 [Anthostomella pinea]